MVLPQGCWNYFGYSSELATVSHGEQWVCAVGRLLSVRGPSSKDRRMEKSIELEIDHPEVAELP